MGVFILSLASSIYCSGFVSRYCSENNDLQAICLAAVLVGSQAFCRIQQLHVENHSVTKRVHAPWGGMESVPKEDSCSAQRILSGYVCATFKHDGQIKRNFKNLSVNNFTY